MTDHVKRIVTTVEVSSGSRDIQYVTLMRVDRIARDAILREFSILRIPEPLKIWYRSLRSDPVSKTALKILHQIPAHARFFKIENVIKKFTAETDQDLLDDAILKPAQKSINESLERIRRASPVVKIVAQCIRNFLLEYLKIFKEGCQQANKYENKVDLLISLLEKQSSNKMLLKEENYGNKNWFKKFDFNPREFLMGFPMAVLKNF